MAYPAAVRPAPVLIAYGNGSYAVRSDRWRYIRYKNGDEELYDHDQDPHEWANLAGVEEHAGLKEELAAWIPD